MQDEKNPDQEGQRDMPTATEQATEATGTDDVVQISTRAPRSLRQRLKVAAAIADVSVQEVQNRAFEEYLRKRDL